MILTLWYWCDMFDERATTTNVTFCQTFSSSPAQHLKTDNQKSNKYHWSARPPSNHREHTLSNQAQRDERGLLMVRSKLTTALLDIDKQGLGQDTSFIIKVRVCHSTGTTKVVDLLSTCACINRHSGKANLWVRLVVKDLALACQ